MQPSAQRSHARVAGLSCSTSGDTYDTVPQNWLMSLFVSS